MDDERYIKPRHKKIDKHFTISINDRKVKILKYNFYSYYDSLAKCEYQVIELITKISNEVFNNRKIEIYIPKDDKTIKILGVFHCALHRPGLSRHSFKIEEYTELPNNSQ